MAVAWEILDDVDNAMSIDSLDQERLEALQTIIAGRIVALARPAAGSEEREGRFAFDVFWSEEDGAYVAALRQPSNWHFSGIGDTPLDAMRELADPIAQSLDDAALRGQGETP